MDEEGLAAALMFPSLHLLSGDIADPDNAANARGYNRWMSDFVSRTLTVCMEWELHP